MTQCVLPRVRTKTTTTRKQSIKALKKFLNISLCHITSLRQVFPVDAYQRRSFDGMQDLMILRQKRQPYAAALQFAQWIEAIYEPIEREYLKEIQLSIFTKTTNNTKELIEQYIFKIKWNTDGSASMDLLLNHEKSQSFTKLKSKDDLTRESRRLFFQMLSLNDILKPIPRSSCYSLELFYNEQCPKDYKPPGPFRNANRNDSQYSNTESVLIKDIGRIETGVNTFGVKLKTTEHRLYPEEDVYQEECDSFEESPPPRKKRKITSLKSKRVTKRVSVRSVKREVIQEWMDLHPYCDINALRAEYPHENLPKLMSIWNEARCSQKKC